MEFEFDPAKSAANLEKHGIDFHRGQRLWDDPDILVTVTDYLGEERSLATGRLGGKLWTAVFTRRGQRLRIISVRRARQMEVQNYEQDRNRNRTDTQS